ncbi:hypothetical protein C683_0321 [Catellicoccus marimammalium M35/04/3]|uniref:Uncharacterized protein n=1 Tax=Catellicoccus marimammalium M35/04/3 TaxID=1234409 RepID=K8Z9M7_9ENTE|nr:hypothetical protein C683_0321 [Catellicoccus marimammalium M35/04/3]
MVFLAHLDQLVDLVVLVYLFLHHLFLVYYLYRHFLNHLDQDFLVYLALLVCLHLFLVCYLHLDLAYLLVDLVLYLVFLVYLVLLVCLVSLLVFLDLLVYLQQLHLKLLHWHNLPMYLHRIMKRISYHFRKYIHISQLKFFLCSLLILLF